MTISQVKFGSRREGKEKFDLSSQPLSKWSPTGVLREGESGLSLIGANDRGRFALLLAPSGVPRKERAWG